MDTLPREAIPFSIWVNTFEEKKIARREQIFHLRVYILKKGLLTQGIKEKVTKSGSPFLGGGCTYSHKG